MAQQSCAFREFLRRSLCAAAEEVAVSEDGLDRIRIRIARARPSDALHDREIAARGGTRVGLVPVVSIQACEWWKWAR